MGVGGGGVVEVSAEAFITNSGKPNLNYKRWKKL
jgi:hypothetical protein